MFNRFAASATASFTAALGVCHMQSSRSKGAFAQGATSQRPTYPYFNAAVFNNPKFDKRWKGGEDGFIISESKRLIGVADGVGGWADQDICSGVCARFLCRKIGEYFEADQSQGLKQMLLDGVKALQAEKIEGSTTVCLAKLEQSSSLATHSITMRTLNLGDSGYILLRPQSDKSLLKVHRSQEQQHYFNCPFQCGMRYDPPTEAQDDEHSVEHNDIVILGTDGVFDNVFDDQILKQCIYPHIREDGELPKPEDAALCISSLSEVLSYSKKTVTPWTENAVAHGRDKEEELGGKQDDITVIVAQVKLHD